MAYFYSGAKANKRPDEVVRFYYSTIQDICQEAYRLIATRCRQQWRCCFRNGLSEYTYKSIRNAHKTY